MSAPGRMIRVAIPSAAASRSTSSSCRHLPQVYGPKRRGSRGRGVRSSWRSHGVRGGLEHREAAHEHEPPDTGGVHRVQKVTGAHRSCCADARRSRPEVSAAACTTTSAPASASGGEAVAQVGDHPSVHLRIVRRSRRGRCPARAAARARSRRRGIRARPSRPPEERRDSPRAGPCIARLARRRASIRATSSSKSSVTRSSARVRPARARRSRRRGRTPRSARGAPDSWRSSATRRPRLNAVRESS